MKYLLRPLQSIAFVPAALLAVGAGFFLAPPGTSAQSTRIVRVLEEVDPLLSHSSQGYLGVLVTDVDSDTASRLRLKEVRGALITLIDHDAPAGQVGLHVYDVVLEVNGQKVEGADQFGRMLREFPAGRKVTLLLSRDGNTQTFQVQLVDRKVMEQDVWNKLGTSSDSSGQAPALGILPGGGGDVPSTGFHMPFVGTNSLNVGAMVEPLTAQMADYLGVPGGIMVKGVARKSEAAKAGIQARDVILKVDNDAISTTADWDRALRANQGKPVQVTILRDRKQQTVNLQVTAKHKSEVDFQDVFPGLLPDGPCPLMAQLDPAWGTDAATAAEAFRHQMEQFRLDFNPDDFKIDSRQMDDLKNQMEQFRQNFKAEDFKIDSQQIEQFRQDMDQLRQNMKDFDFKIDSKQMDELKKQMEQFRQNFKPDDFEINPKDMEQFGKDMEQLRHKIDQKHMDQLQQQMKQFQQQMQQLRQKMSQEMSQQV
jgi:membrane-associated protease RseP (regulator of RpoE activity)